MSASRPANQPTDQTNQSTNQINQPDKLSNLQPTKSTSQSTNHRPINQQTNQQTNTPSKQPSNSRAVFRSSRAHGSLTVNRRGERVPNQRDSQKPEKNSLASSSSPRRRAPIYRTSTYQQVPPDTSFTVVNLCAYTSATRS